MNQDLLALLVDRDLLPKQFKHNTQLSPWHTPVSVSYQKSDQMPGLLEVTILNVPSKSCYQLGQLIHQSGGTHLCIDAGTKKQFKGRFDVQGVQ